MIFGQPRGLATLFLTEMWERFTFYGMRGILVLFMVDAAAHGGLGLDDRTATTVYGLYLSGTYLLSLAGGWIADRLIGAQRAVISGGVMIMIGNAMLASASTQVFFLGLVVVVCGVGMLKPNVSAMVAQLYPEGGTRRDAGFSIFYMGINIGSFVGAVAVPFFAAWLGWHWGFALPALGMLLGLAQFVATRRYLGSAGIARAPDAPRGSWTPIFLLAAVIAAAAVLAITGRLQIDPIKVSSIASWLMVALALAYFLYLIFFAGLDRVERGRVYVLVALAAGGVMFWAGFEQVGASLNLFADRYTDRHILGWEMPAGVLQAVYPALVIAFAPVFAALWLRLGRRRRELSPPTKFAAGLLLMGLGFLVMSFAARRVLGGATVLPTWLISTALLLTFGELCLSPVGLSWMTKLVPTRFAGQVMGVWFLSLALGNNLAGQLSSEYDSSHLETLPGLFLKIFWWGVIAGVVMLICTPRLKKLMAGVQ
jgi:POT family proton-dependent oligopeptide transporter